MSDIHPLMACVREAERERDRYRAALERSREALHRACLKLGTTDDFVDDFAAINEVLTPLEAEQATTNGMSARAVGDVIRFSSGGRVCTGKIIEVCDNRHVRVDTSSLTIPPAWILDDDDDDRGQMLNVALEEPMPLPEWMRR